MKHFFVAVMLLGLCGSSAFAQWQAQTAPSQADFRGLAVASSNVAWVSGTKGTFARTTDGGKTWSVGTVPGADNLDYRDVEAFGETAYLLSAGPGDASRIYKTIDGGKSWALQFKSADPAAFLDAIAFWDEHNGIALGDPVRGLFQLIVTTDGGTNWKPLAANSLSPALIGEGAFAASGTCLVTHGASDVWFATGGAKTARIFHSKDRGRNWEVSDTPVGANAASAGIFSITFRDRQHGMIVGGDYRRPHDTGATAATTSDGGKTWALLDKRLPFCSAVAWAKDRWVAVGTSGSHVSLDDGATWQVLDRENYNSVGFASTGAGWAVGPKGRIAKFTNVVAGRAATPPEAEIDNGVLKAKFYLPDAQKGFYRGTRFDWSGVIGSLEYKGHKYYGPWFTKTDPNINDFIYQGADIVAGPCSAITGPVEEFSTDGKALGYDEAKPGGTFIKIGVGVLRKPRDGSGYNTFRLYEIVDPGIWKVRTMGAAIEFTHDLADPSSGYGYRYQKTIQLVQGRPDMVMDHKLKNTGKRSIKSSVYNHNFLVLDGQPPGPDFVIKMPFQIKTKRAPDSALAEVRGNQVVYRKALRDKETVFTQLHGFGPTAADYRFTIENKKTGAGLHIAGDRPLSDVFLWSIRSVLSLEPFIAMTIEPGQEFTWKYTYTYYLTDGDTK